MTPGGVLPTDSGDILTTPPLFGSQEAGPTLLWSCPPGWLSLPLYHGSTTVLSGEVQGPSPESCSQLTCSHDPGESSPDCLSNSNKGQGGGGDHPTHVIPNQASGSGLMDSDVPLSVLGAGLPIILGPESALL